MFIESWGHGPGAEEGPRDVPRVLRTGSARPYPNSRVLPARRETGVRPARREKRGVRGKKRRTRDGVEMDEGAVRVHGGMRQTGKDCSDMVRVRRVSAGPFCTV
jgi:hypothetical protein